MRGATPFAFRTSSILSFQSTHPMRGATVLSARRTPVAIFQSTHPMRGATILSSGVCVCACYFNPRTPCGVRPVTAARSAGVISISIHAPHAGCDRVVTVEKAGIEPISIHAPHAGCDQKQSRPTQNRRKHFNPRTPCGVRRPCRAPWQVPSDFNPRTPCGVRRRRKFTPISVWNFNPRTPCGVRRSDPAYSAQR